MNKLTLEKIATPLLKACKDEGLMYKEAAKIFNTEPAYFKMLEREDKRGCIPEKVMDRFHSWVYSGKKLKEYKMPESFNLPTMDSDMKAGVGEKIIGPFKSVAELNKEVAEHEKKSKRNKEPAIRRTSKLNDVIKGKMRQMVEKQEADIKAKGKRKYTRKPKESPPEFTSPDFSDIQIIPIAKAVPDVRPDVYLDVPDIQMVESETDLLKSEIKTLAALLAREHEANEVLRAQNGYLKARVAYNANRAIELIKNVRADNRKLHDILHEVAVPEWVKDDRLELRLKNEELEESLRKLSHRGFWARVFNRPIK